MRRLMLALAAVALVACNSDSSTSPSANAAVGTWTLVKANNQTLPATDPEDGNIIQSGSVSFTADLKFTYTEHRSTGTNTTSGSYTISGNNINFTPTNPDEGTATGVISGNQLTVTPTGQGSVVLLFNKS
jgi:hypothetical protein